MTGCSLKIEGFATPYPAVKQVRLEAVEPRFDRHCFRRCVAKNTLNILYSSAFVDYSFFFPQAISIIVFRTLSGTTGTHPLLKGKAGLFETSSPSPKFPEYVIILSG
jgi:hypothetical protein